MAGTAHQRSTNSPQCSLGSPSGGMLPVRSLAGLRGFITSFCLFVLALLFIYFVAEAFGWQPEEAQWGKAWEGEGVGREQCPAEQEREAPSPESRPLCPPPPGLADGKTLHNPAIVCLETAMASYCNYFWKKIFDVFVEGGWGKLILPLFLFGSSVSSSCSSCPVVPVFFLNSEECPCL